MRHTFAGLQSGTIPTLGLLASAIVGFLALASVILLEEEPVSSMRIEPEHLTLSVGEFFDIEVVVVSSVPVNVFAGELRFSKDLLAVESINYNTSIADLWAELPWFSNGDGTLNFAGGSTRAGGFVGEGSLIKVTFKTLGEGEGVVSVYKPRILLHDGLGTDASVSKPIDAVLTIEQEDKNLIHTESFDGTTYQVTKKLPSPDLNGDGKRGIADVSVFMLNMAKGGERYDFNLDGSVNLKDLNILLSY